MMLTFNSVDDYDYFRDYINHAYGRCGSACRICLDIIFSKEIHNLRTKEKSLEAD